MSPAGRVRTVAVVGLLGLAAGVLVTLRLAAVLPEVPNRHAFTYDSSRRALVDVDAADALRRQDLGRLLWDVAGPEQWPTLRLLVAAPAHALAGPARALGVELGVSVAFVGLLVLALALSATALAGGPGEALALFAISCPLLLGNRDLLEHAANGMLEVPEAVFTLGATVASIHAREVGSARPWGLALLGNALFHVKFQYGLFLTAAVLLTETLGPGGLRRLGAIARSLAGAARRPWGLAVLALGLGTTLLGAWLVHTGGVQNCHPRPGGAPRTAPGRPLVRRGDPLRVRLARVPCGPGLARSPAPPAAALRLGLAAHPDGALAPRALQLAARDAGDEHHLRRRDGRPRPRAPVVVLSRAAWMGWFPPEIAWVAIALLGMTLLAALPLHPGCAPSCVPIGAVVTVELAALAFLSGRNFQPRLSVNLAPLVALVAALWAPEIRRPWLRAVLAGATSTVLLVAVLPGWRRAPLASVVGRGFEAGRTATPAGRLARALPLSSGELVNETHPTGSSSATSG